MTRLLIVLWMLKFGGSLPFACTVGHHGRLYSRSCRSMESKTISGSHSAEIEVKKSRFIGNAAHADSWTRAQAYIDAIRHQHPKARHWCYAYCGGGTNERSSDDGEPSGTAGAPILNAIHGQDLSDTVCVVVRYFGGIKLGAGGLVRAYGGAARLVLSQAPVAIRVPQSSLRVRVDTMYIGALYDVVASVKGDCRDEHYDTDGRLTITVTCETTSAIRLQESLRDASRGSVEFLETT